MGNQVAPAELESMLSHPRVTDVAVVGKPSEKVGEIPWDFVVAKGEISVSEKELLQWVKETVDTRNWEGLLLWRKLRRKQAGKF